MNSGLFPKSDNGILKDRSVTRVVIIEQKVLEEERE